MTLPHSTNPMKYPARFQWRQGGPCGGSSCCTDTCMQMIIEFYKEKTYSLSTIRRDAQLRTAYNEAPCTGLNYHEVLNGLDWLAVRHYKVAFGISVDFVLNKLAYGPVMVGVHYGSYPNWFKGSHSNRAERGGRTDYNFKGAHAVLVVGSRKHYSSTGKYMHRDFYVRDPDHHSYSRPEAPVYDIITAAQLKRAMANLPTYTAFNQSYSIYPTQKKVL